MDWWNELTQLQRFFGVIAIPSTAIMIIQFVLLIAGISNGDGTDLDADLDADVDMELQDGFDSDFDDGITDSPGEVHESVDALRLFTLRSIIAFLSIGGWMGVTAAGWGLSFPVVFLLAFAAGWLALYFVTWSIRTALRLQQSGNMLPENAVGNAGEVYIPIPAAKKGTGKVSVIVQDRLSEFDAFTEADRTLKTGEEIIVVGTTPEGVLLVTPRKSPPEGVIIEKEF